MTDAQLSPIDHVAVLVADLEAALRDLTPLGLETGPIEEFPSEGTRECYLGRSDQSAKLLLLTPHGDAGPYARALARRGPGLHHVGLRAASPRELAAGRLVTLLEAYEPPAIPVSSPRRMDVGSNSAITSKCAATVRR